MTSSQLWSEVPASIGKKVGRVQCLHSPQVGPVGFLKAVLDSESSWSLELVSHLCPWLFIRAVTAWGIFTFIFCPRVSLSASLTKTTVAANAQKHGSHPVATGSSHLDSYTTRRCHGPTVYVRTLSAVWFFSCTKRLKSHVTSGSPNAGALVKSLYLLEGLFLFRSPLQGALTRPCCVFKQRLGDFRETWYPDPAEFGSPEELTDFFLGVPPRYWTDSSLPLVSEHPMPFCDDKPKVLDLLSADLSLFPWHLVSCGGEQSQ